uniref:Uncharacterized protein n=1 Tax=Cacopsylla melanoneura TaxID=428564 RepID=A0A8D8V811_9HEMI
MERAWSMLNKSWQHCLPMTKVSLFPKGQNCPLVLHLLFTPPMSVLFLPLSYTQQTHLTRFTRRTTTIILIMSYHRTIIPLKIITLSPSPPYSLLSIHQYLNPLVILCLT